MSRRSAREKRRGWGKMANKVVNLLRLMPAVSAGVTNYVLRGFTDNEGNEERRSAIAYLNGGFASRPRSQDTLDAVVAHVGGESNSPIVIATRDPAAIAAFETAAGALAEGETALFTASGAFVKIDVLGNVTVSPSPTGFVRMGRGAAASALLPSLNGVVTGIDVDSFTGLPLWMLGSGSAIVTAQKL